MSEFIDPLPTVTMEPGCAGAMKMTMSISDGTHVWMAIAPEDWGRFKTAGDQAMADTIRLTAEARDGQDS